MGILNDFKKLFWAKKAVAKSAARKVGEEGKELAEDGYEKVKDFSHKVADKAEDAFEEVKEFGGKVVDKAGDALEDARDYAKDLMDDVWGEKKTTPVSKPNDPIQTTTNLNQMKEEQKPQTEVPPVTEKKEKIIDKAVEMSDKAWEKAEDLAGKAKDLAKKAGEKIEGKLDELYEKAKDLDKKIEEERKAIDPNNDGFADKSVNEKLREQGSLLKDKDDFWAKADAFSKGDYSMGKPVVVGKDKKDPATDDKLDLKPVSEIRKKGDGGEDLIDDAEIVDDTEPKKE